MSTGQPPSLLECQPFIQRTDEYYEKKSRKYKRLLNKNSERFFEKLNTKRLHSRDYSKQVIRGLKGRLTADEYYKYENKYANAYFKLRLMRKALSNDILGHERKIAAVWERQKLPHNGDQPGADAV